MLGTLTLDDDLLPDKNRVKTASLQCGLADDWVCIDMEDHSGFSGHHLGGAAVICHVTALGLRLCNPPHTPEK